MSLFTTVTDFLNTGGFKQNNNSNQSNSNSKINHYPLHYPSLNLVENNNENMSMSGSFQQFPGEFYHPDDLRPEMRFFNYELFKRFTPDINGYILAFIIPPPLDGFLTKNEQYIRYFKQLSCFAVMDITPPMPGIQSDRVSNRSGGVPFAIEINPSEQMTVTYLDNLNMDIYNFHMYWYYYIKEVVEGIIEPPPGDYLNYDSELYGALDYAGGAYIVKYDPSMQTIRYVGKAYGIYPTFMPTREMLGARTNNEIVIVPWT